MKKDSKQRLFEVMARLDKTFKLNENVDNSEEFFPISTPVGSEDDALFIGIVNQGIDSSLEGFTKSNFEVKPGSLGNRRIFNFHKDEIPILLRRLGEVGTEEAQQWIEDIQNQENNINELNEMGGRAADINPKYTHFAVLKNNSKILNGYDYTGYDLDELKSDKMHYFFNDIIDMDIDPKLVGIYTRKKLEKDGVNPFDTNNWYKFNNPSNNPDFYK